VPHALPCGRNWKGAGSEVLHVGGYDLAQKPLEPKCFAALVNGALALAKSIDSPEP